MSSHPSISEPCGVSMFWFSKGDAPMGGHSKNVLNFQLRLPPGPFGHVTPRKEEEDPHCILHAVGALKDIGKQRVIEAMTLDKKIQGNGRQGDSLFVLEVQWRRDGITFLLAVVPFSESPSPA